MSDENVVNFPNAKNQEVEEEPLNGTDVKKVAEMNEQQATEFLNLIDKNRAFGISQLNNSVNQQEGRPLFDPQLVPNLENTVRALEKGLQGSLTSTEAINSMVDMIRHDMVNVIQNLQQMQQAVVIASTQCNVLLRVLDAKGVISEEEIVAKFKEMQEAQQV